MDPINIVDYEVHTGEQMINLLNFSGVFRQGYYGYVNGHSFIYDGYCDKYLQFYAYGRAFAIFVKEQTGNYSYWMRAGLSPEGKELLILAIEERVIV